MTGMGSEVDALHDTKQIFAFGSVRDLCIKIFSFGSWHVGIKVRGATRSLAPGPTKNDLRELVGPNHVLKC